MWVSFLVSLVGFATRAPVRRGARAANPTKSNLSLAAIGLGLKCYEYVRWALCACRLRTVHGVFKRGLAAGAPELWLVLAAAARVPPHAAADEAADEDARGPEHGVDEGRGQQVGHEACKVAR